MVEASDVVVRHARLPSERPIIERLHSSFLEVQYDDRFYTTLERDAACIALVACVGGSIVGVATARNWDDDSSSGWARQYMSYYIFGSRAGYIMTLGVLPAFRGRGVGSSLLKRVCEILGRAGCSDVRLHCLASNTAGRGLYSSHGFMETEYLTAFYQTHIVYYIVSPHPLFSKS